MSINSDFSLVSRLCIVESNVDKPGGDPVAGGGECFGVTDIGDQGEPVDGWQF
jgi:hypothetical protein